MTASKESRRTFLGKASMAGVAVAASSVAAGEAVASERPGGRRVVKGSPRPVFSRAVVFDKLVYVAGVIGRKGSTGDLASADFETQCGQALANLKASVEASGSGMDKVLKCTCFLTEASDFAAFNKIYATYFPTDPPARSTVIVKALVVPDAKLEIDCVTCLG